MIEAGQDFLTTVLLTDAVDVLQHTVRNRISCHPHVLNVGVTIF